MSLLPRIRGTNCTLCGWSVPALGATPDTEMSWFERFEGRPCPNCCGLALGMVGAWVLASLLGPRRVYS